ANGRLPCQRIDALIGFQIRIVLAQGRQGGVNNLVGCCAIFPQADDHERSFGTLECDGPAFFGFLALEAPAFPVAKTNAAVIELCGHSCYLVQGVLATSNILSTFDGVLSDPSPATGNTIPPNPSCRSVAA